MESLFYFGRNAIKVYATLCRMIHNHQHFVIIDDHQNNIISVTKSFALYFLWEIM